MALIFLTCANRAKARWPSFLIGSISFSNFGWESPKDHSYDVSMKLDNWLRRSRVLKQKLTDGQRGITIVSLWLSGELKREIWWIYLFSASHIDIILLEVLILQLDTKSYTIQWQMDKCQAVKNNPQMYPMLEVGNTKNKDGTWSKFNVKTWQIW